MSCRSHTADDRRTAPSTGRRGAAVALSSMLLVAGCGADAPTGPAVDEPRRGDDRRAMIEVDVVLPPDWPNPISDSNPEVIVEGPDGDVRRAVAGERLTTIRLPGAGNHSVGDPPITVGDGDVIHLRDTGALCDWTTHRNTSESGDRRVSPRGDERRNEHRSTQVRAVPTARRNDGR